MQPVEWWRVLWLVVSVRVVTGDHAVSLVQDYDYREVYTADEDMDQRERYYQEDEGPGPVRTEPMHATEKLGIPRVRRYGDKEVEHQQLDDIRDVLKDILEGQGIDKFFASSSLLTTLAERARVIEPTLTEARIADALTAFIDDQEPTRSSRSRPSPPTHSSVVSRIIDDEEDFEMPRRRGDSGDDDEDDEDLLALREGSNTTTASTSTTSTTTTSRCVTRLRRTTTTTSKPPVLDIDSLLAIIANLTYDYDTNFTRMLNESLKQFSIPTCVTPTTTTEATTFMPDYSLYNATIMAKCFVCGLQQHGVPINAYCADAFAGDFIPLVPVDPKAKGQISRYRKYCRYRDVHNFVLNESLPRSIFGRWTGGCSVRWIDLSGVYTQRSCRNRHRAVLGRHYGSKRMAKLEMALQHVDNGCIISPMATLVPLSRGISLYARFHACVCTGSWCNRTLRARPCTTNITTLLFLLLRQFVT